MLNIYNVLMRCINCLFVFFIADSSENWLRFQGLSGWAQPQAAALFHTGIVPNQTHPEGAKISPPAEGALLAHRPRQWGTLPPGRYDPIQIILTRGEPEQIHMVKTVLQLFAVAMKAMNKVASHINEMQKIHEEFGAVFDQLITEQSGEKKEVRWTNVAWLGCWWKGWPCGVTFVFLLLFARLLICLWVTCYCTLMWSGSILLPP